MSVSGVRVITLHWMRVWRGTVWATLGQRTKAGGNEMREHLPHWCAERPCPQSPSAHPNQLLGRLLVFLLFSQSCANYIILLFVPALRTEGKGRGILPGPDTPFTCELLTNPQCEFPLLVLKCPVFRFFKTTEVLVCNSFRFSLAFLCRELERGCPELLTKFSK